ncbi:hypothetical protein [Pseudactinotalea sp.]|uniref:hypothetical protein n=1 Tax=Pseudactinotalea sp. TaxID=1926260 RepID=UPI003B3ACB86
MPQTSAPGFDPRQPFTRADASAAGLTWRYLDGPRCQQLLPGVFLDADVVPTPALLARAGMLLVPTAEAACHLTAAEILELPVPLSDEVHLLLPPQAARVRRKGIRVHHGTRRLSIREGVTITTALETFGDVAPDVSLVEAVVLGDAVVHEGYATVSALTRAAARVSGGAGQRVRAAAELVRARVISPRETRLRLLLLFSGLPEPVIAYPVTAGGRARELDTAYPEWRVAVEYDGRHHVERDLQWSEDIERREDLNGEQWNLITVTGMQMWDPERVIMRVRRALQSAGAPLPPISQEWRRHFPTRRRSRR